MKYVLAISGGIDSMVLLDMVIHKKILPVSSISDDITVAHFDHGIRIESEYDAKLVGKIAKNNQLDFVVGRKKLGKDASESTARQARYQFLRAVVQNKTSKQDKTGDKQKWCLVTAHHQDDLLETIVMNILRGTNWRGLAPMWAEDIKRPLLKYSKADLIEYAIKNKLEWAEDETNYSSKYFRNRVRAALYVIESAERKKLVELYNKQKIIRNEIESILESTSCVASLNLKKEQIESLPNEVALEVLRKWTNEKLTYPQLKRLLQDIINTKNGIDIQPGGKLTVSIKKGNLSLSEL